MQVRDRLTWILILIFLSCFIFASAPCVFTVPTFALLPALISQQLIGSPSFAILGLKKPFTKYIIAICESARWFSHRFFKMNPKMASWDWPPFIPVLIFTAFYGSHHVFHLFLFHWTSGSPFKSKCSISLLSFFRISVCFSICFHFSHCNTPAKSASKPSEKIVQAWIESLRLHEMGCRVQFSFLRLMEVERTHPFLNTQ